MSLREWKKIQKMLRIGFCQIFIPHGKTTCSGVSQDQHERPWDRKSGEG